MSVSDADAAFAQELFSGLGALTARQMMGGLCLYAGGTIFAILQSDGSIWLKGAGAFANRAAREGWTRWTYSREGRKITAMPYWQLPDAALDDPALACMLAREALSEL